MLRQVPEDYILTRSRRGFVKCDDSAILIPRAAVACKPFQRDYLLQYCVMDLIIRPPLNNYQRLC